MYLVYQPEGTDEPQRWPYNPRKLMSAEREALERRTGMVFAEFTKAVVEGSSLARRSLLWVMLKREHPQLKFDDVDFAWDELSLEFSRSEYDQMIEQASDALTGPEREAVLDKMRADRETAFEDPEHEGKASPPVVA